MEERKQLLMVEKVNQVRSRIPHGYYPVTEDEEELFNYANFLCSPIKLGDFIPTDEDGDVIEEPIRPPNKRGDSAMGEDNYYWDKLKEYREAVDRLVYAGATSVTYKNKNIIEVCINSRCFVLYQKTDTRETLTDIGLILTENKARSLKLIK